MLVSRRPRLMILAIAALLSPVTAPAQPAAQEPPAATAGWDDGFVIQSPDGRHRLQVGTILQADGRFSLEDESAVTDTFVLRKARPVFSGSVARYFDFKLMPELAGGSASLLDAYFDVRLSPAFRLRSGKDKTPVGYELLVGDTVLLFAERSVASLLVPNRDVGFQALGELAGGRFLYAGGIFNGNVLDGASNLTDVDVNDGKDLAGRVVVLPFAAHKHSSWKNVGFHLGASTGTQSGALPSFRTSGGQTFFSFSGATANGRRSRVTPAAFLYYGRFGGFAEFVRTQHEIARGDLTRTLAHHAWNVTASYVLTGEPASERGVRPRAPFDPVAGSWGALQLAARVARIALDEDAIALGLTTAQGSRTARQLTLAVSWYLNAVVRVYGNYERFTFADSSRAGEHVVIFRSQLAF